MIPDASVPTVLVHDLFCLYPTPRGHFAALRGLTLEVAAGERVVVNGPNGSGKTTLLRVLTGECGPSAGTATVCGVDLAGVTERDRVHLRRHRIGSVNQHPFRTLRPELSVLDNVALQSRLAGHGRRSARSRAGALLDQLGLDHLAARGPSSLSGGEAQRVAVCAAVAHGPALLLADEPTGDLDRDTAGAVYDLLVRASAASGAALVLVSHDEAAARIADRIVRIRDGRLSEEWTPTDAGHESLVVDDRGWVRLPEALRVQTGVTARVSAATRNDAILLRSRTPDSVPVQESTVDVTVEPVPGVVGQEIVTLSGVRVDRAGRRILDGQNLRLCRGVLTVVRGRSGSGKSTLIRVVAGLERPEAGTVRVAGTELAGLNRAELAELRRRHLAIAAQSVVLVETLDVVANLELVRHARRGESTMDFDVWIEALGLSALRHRPVRVLSGGERQRVAVARALAAAPAVALLDEPTSQQDEAHAERLSVVLRTAARRGAAVLAATHDPVLVAAADLVVTLP